MAWKPKEKPLTHEEAIAVARAELAPFWMGSEPLIAAIRAREGKASVHPLDKDFERRSWALIFVDLMNYKGEGVLRYAREWARRYAAHNLGVLLVVRPSLLIPVCRGCLGADPQAYA